MDSTPLSLPYLAGFIDGEGCFSVIAARDKRRGPEYVRYRPVLVICNTNLPILERIRETIGAGVINPYSTSQRGPKDKQAYQYQLTGKPLAPFIRIILPHLIMKAEVAAEVLAVADLAPGYNYAKFTPEQHEQRLEHVARIRALNRKGRERAFA